MIDTAITFGKGNSPTSRLLYHRIFDLIRDRIPSFAKVYDLGGGNGVSKAYFPSVVTVDNNPEMEPDILADILEFEVPDEADLILIRYVAHYLQEEQLIKLLERSSHKPILFIQFTNSDPDDKLLQSLFKGQGEEDHKTFRDWDHFVHLLEPRGFRQIIRVDYEVEPMFYVERFGRQGAYFPHPESLGVWFKP
jgi:hypothetical protein